METYVLHSYDCSALKWQNATRNSFYVLLKILLKSFVSLEPEGIKYYHREMFLTNKEMRKHKRISRIER